MDNFTKNILAGIRQWFHKNQDDAQVVLTSHIAELHSIASFVQADIAVINNAITEINAALKERLTTIYLSQEEYDAISRKDKHVIYIISNPYSANCYIGSYPIYSKIPDNALYFKAEGVDSTIAINITNGAEFEYSTDWYSWKPYTSGEVIPIPAYDRVYFRGSTVLGTDSNTSGKYAQFSMTGKISAHGDLRQLYGNSELTNYHFYKIFCDCTSLIAAPELPATTLANSCYASMFEGCTSLTKVPKILPASYCGYNVNIYRRMFYGCTSITTAPTINLRDYRSGHEYYILQEMFANCSNLAYVKCLIKSAMSGRGNNFQNWLLGVAETGTFVKAAGSSWPNGQSGIPKGWTVEEVEPESSN